MSSQEFFDIVQKISEHLDTDFAYPGGRTLLQADVYGDGGAFMMLWRDRGNFIVGRFVNMDFVPQALTALWRTQTDEPRWSHIEMLFEDGKFQIEFEYVDLDANKEWASDRAERWRLALLGDKPINDENGGFAEYFVGAWYAIEKS